MQRDPADDPLAVKEIMPDCCTPEYECVLAEFGALLPYRRACALLETFFPVGDLPTIDTIQRRTLQVGARLEREAIVAPARASSPAEAETIGLFIASGHVRAQLSGENLRDVRRAGRLGDHLHHSTGRGRPTAPAAARRAAPP